MSKHSAASARLDRCVVQYGDRMVKGYMDFRLLAATSSAPQHRASVPIRPEGSDGQETLSLEGIKAVFFVHSFQGDGHEDIRFHDQREPLGGLWVRVTFQDGEVLEGLIRNTQHCVLDSGFFVAPSDPEGNNWLVYVAKEQLRNFQVLGLRPIPKILDEFFPLASSAPLEEPSPELQL